jgi:hypothetical protein
LISPAENFTHVGRAVTHTARPRFVVVFAPGEQAAPAETLHGPAGIACGASTTCNGQPWHAAKVEWIDEPPRDAKVLSRLLRLAADHWQEHWREDWLMEAAIARAEALGLTAYEIAKRTGWAVSADHVKDYLSRKKSMGSNRLQHVLKVLGLRLEA